MANWFECKVRFDKTMENGTQKKVTEPYLVDAFTFTEAEARIIKEITPFISADKWYMAKVAFITIDEKTAVEKRAISQMLVAGGDFKNAYDNLIEEMSTTSADYEIVSISETLIMDVYKADLSGNAEK